MLTRAPSHQVNAWYLRNTIASGNHLDLQPDRLITQLEGVMSLRLESVFIIFSMKSSANEYGRDEMIPPAELSPSGRCVCIIDLNFAKRKAKLRSEFCVVGQ